LKVNKIIIFGASGFIGKNIALNFKKKFKNTKIIGTYFKNKPYVKGIRFIKCDLRNKKSVDKILKKADIIIQAAAITSGAKEIINKPNIHVSQNAIMNSIVTQSAFENYVKHVILFIDYGYLQSKGIDTLQSVMSHKKNKYFNNIGKADITYLVNFQLLKKFIESNSLFLNEIVEQNFFLKKMGISERAEILSRKMTFKEKSDLYYRLERLLSEKKMGSLFKVLFANSENLKFNLGFK